MSKCDGEQKIPVAVSRQNSGRCRAVVEEGQVGGDPGLGVMLLRWPVFAAIEVDV